MKITHITSVLFSLIATCMLSHAEEQTANEVAVTSNQSTVDEHYNQHPASSGDKASFEQSHAEYTQDEGDANFDNHTSGSPEPEEEECGECSGQYCDAPSCMNGCNHEEEYAGHYCDECTAHEYDADSYLHAAECEECSDQHDDADMHGLDEQTQDECSDQHDDADTHGLDEQTQDECSDQNDDADTHVQDEQTQDECSDQHDDADTHGLDEQTQDECPDQHDDADTHGLDEQTQDECSDQHDDADTRGLDEQTQDECSDQHDDADTRGQDETNASIQ